MAVDTTFAKYNQGGNTSSIGEQLQDFHYAKFIVEAAKHLLVFSHLGTKVAQPKHYGETIKSYVEYPIMHDANVNDQGIDADGVRMTSGKWYSWDAAGVREEHDTKEDAKARVGLVRIESGNGNLGGTDRDFVVQLGSLPVLTEVGGVVNGVGLRRDVIQAKITEYGISLGFTKRELELDTQPVLLSKYSKRLSEAFGMIRERIVRNGLLQAGLDNVVFAGSGALVKEDLSFTNQLTFNTLRLLEQTLDLDLVPIDTKVITGSKNLDTVVAPASRFVYIPYQLKHVVEDILDNRGNPAFTPVEKYTAGASYIAKGEIGKILRFRFIVVTDMPYFMGIGKPVDAADAYPMMETNGQYDGFPLLFVGEDSFSTMALEGDSTVMVETAMPRAIEGVDRYAKKGSMAISWYQGMLIRRPERIKVVLCTGASL